MSVQFLIISDIHACQENIDSISAKIFSLEGLVATKRLNLECLIVLIVGDVAARGKSEEFEEVKACLELFRDNVKAKFSGLSVSFISVPGNHDLDFDINKDVCQIIAQNADKNLSGAYNFLSERHKNYFKFQEELCGYSQENRAYHAFSYKLQSGHKLAFRLYNSSCSLPEGMKPGEYVYPVEMAEQDDSLDAGGGGDFHDASFT